MWTFPEPPPKSRIEPLFHVLSSETIVHRIYDPAAHESTPNGFRYDGPIERLDHHIPGEPRGIMYAAEEFQGCLAQVYGGHPQAGYALQRRHSLVLLEREMLLLDLRGTGAVAAGTTPHICSGEYPTAQQWSRFFYDHPSYYDEVGGLVYSTAYKHLTAYAFYDRGVGDALGYVVSQNALSEPAHVNHYSRLAYDLELAIDFTVVADPDI